MKHAKHIKRGFKRFGRKIFTISPFTIKDYERPFWASQTVHSRSIPGAAIGWIIGNSQGF